MDPNQEDASRRDLSRDPLLSICGRHENCIICLQTYVRCRKIEESSSPHTSCWYDEKYVNVVQERLDYLWWKEDSQPGDKHVRSNSNTQPAEPSMNVERSPRDKMSRSTKDASGGPLWSSYDLADSSSTPELGWSWLDRVV